MRSALAQLTDNLSWIETQDSAQLNELHHVYPALTGLQVRNPALIDTELLGEVHLAQTSILPELDQHGCELLLNRWRDRLWHPASRRGLET